MKLRHLASLIVALSLVVLGAGRAAAEPPYELIVMLSSGPFRPSPEQVVTAINTGAPLPGGLGVGSPQSASFVISQRAAPAFKTVLAASPGSPRAQLERAIVIRYGTESERDTALAALASSSYVEEVGLNSTGEISATIPNDPYMFDTGDPETFQWGPYALGLPEAWDRIRGHAYIGVADGGVEVTSEGECYENVAGPEVGHPDLQAFSWNGAHYTFEGGAFRSVFARDFGNPDSQTSPDYCVNEKEAESVNGIVGGARYEPDITGHGTHVSGILAAGTNNALGVAGSGWYTSLMVAKVYHLIADHLFAQVSMGNSAADDAEGLTWLVDRGAQLISMSWNTGGTEPEPGVSAAIQHAADRDLVLLAASGNSQACTATDPVRWPARDGRVIGVGATEPGGEWACYSLWDSSTLDFAAPGSKILATFTAGGLWTSNSLFECRDVNFGSGSDGYGRCSGTSMAAPMLAGLAALLRSANPLLPRTAVQDMLNSTAVNTCLVYPERCGAGTPVGGAAAERALGLAAGQPLRNRLTPAFGLYSSVNKDHLTSTVPQMASAAICDVAGGQYKTHFSGEGDLIASYGSFPGLLSTCPTGLNRTPRAAFYLFSSSLSPRQAAADLAPLFRMSKTIQNDRLRRTHRYAAQESEVTDLKNAGWELDGVEGFLYSSCNASDLCDASCSPPGLEGLKQLYKSTDLGGDFILTPVSRESDWTSQGYGPIGGAPACLGFVFASTDSDSDGVIDGFEELIGSSSSSSDSDCDGLPDVAETHSYSTTTHSYGDPIGVPRCAGTLLREDGFEATPVWDSLASVGTFVRSGDSAPIFGNRSLEVEVNPMWNGPELPAGFLTDVLPAPTNRFRARFFFWPKLLSMAEGNQHSILLARTSAGAEVFKIQLRRNSGLFQIRLRVSQDTAPAIASAWRTIDNSEVTAVEVDWSGSTGASASDAYAKLWVNGSLTDFVGPRFDAFDLRVSDVSLGLVEGTDPGTSGVHVFDEFESRTATYIGLTP